jgi:hypothetical protein
MESKIPVNIIHLSATSEGSLGNSIHENDPKILISSGIFNIVLPLAKRKPSSADGINKPFTTRNEINKSGGL